MTVRHLLLDADDVVQVGFGPFRTVLHEAFGEDPTEWLLETFDPAAGVLDGGTPVLRCWRNGCVSWAGTAMRRSSTIGSG